jgi:hypothetical protein
MTQSRTLTARRRRLPRQLTNLSRALENEMFLARPLKLMQAGHVEVLAEEPPEVMEVRTLRDPLSFIYVRDTPWFTCVLPTTIAL